MPSVWLYRAKGLIPLFRLRSISFNSSPSRTRCTAHRSRVLDDVEVNPLAYSMGPNQKIIEEEFEQSDDVVSWEGGSTDFSFEEESPIKQNVNKTNIPESEEL